MLHRIALAIFGRLPRRLRTRVVRTLYPTFTVGVCVCFLRRDGRMCLVTHSYSPGWGLPGGMLDGDEWPAQTVSREVREELGIDVTVTDPPLPIRSPDRRHFNLLFRLEIDDSAAESMAPHSPEITGVGWFDPADLPELSEFTDMFLAELGVIAPPD